MVMFFAGIVTGSVFSVIAMTLLVVNKDDVYTDSNGRGDCILQYRVWNKLDDIQSDDLGIDDYQHLAARTINLNNTPDENERHALHGISSEAGEIHDIYQKRYQGHHFDEDHLKKEIGDLMWCVSELCVIRGFRLSDICKLNIEKLKERYPNGFDVDRSINRREGDI